MLSCRAGTRQSFAMKLSWSRTNRSQILVEYLYNYIYLYTSYTDAVTTLVICEIAANRLSLGLSSLIKMWLMTACSTYFDAREKIYTALPWVSQIMLHHNFRDSSCAVHIQFDTSAISSRPSNEDPTMNYLARISIPKASHKATHCWDTASSSKIEIQLRFNFSYPLPRSRIFGAPSQPDAGGSAINQTSWVAKYGAPLWSSPQSIL